MDKSHGEKVRDTRECGMGKPGCEGVTDSFLKVRNLS